MMVDIYFPPAKDVLDHGLSDYQKGMNDFYLELINLNVNIYIVEKVLQFPFNLFFSGEPERTIFFSSVIANALDASILTITKLATDQGENPNTLIRFKNRVCEMVKAEYKESFDKHVAKARFDKETKKLLEKAKAIRNNRIAHRKHSSQELSKKDIEENKLDFQELKVLRDKLNDLLQTLSFDAAYPMLPWSYKTGSSSSYPSDIEYFLDCIAKDNPILSLLEREPDRWQYVQPILTEADMNHFNQYRKKFGLPEI